jgi:hypothetical protein
MSSVEHLIATLEKCIPQFDPTPLSDYLPKSTDENTTRFAPGWTSLAYLPKSINKDAMLDWLYWHLGLQQLIDCFDWKEYSGNLPDLKPLKSLDLSGCDPKFILEMLQNLDEKALENLPFIVPYELPFLEYINDAIKPHGLRLVTFAHEYAYILCVRDDEALLNALAASLLEFGIQLVKNETMSREEIIACFTED